MGKSKGPKEGKNSKSHLKARMGFLEKAANYLQAATAATIPAEVAERDDQKVSDKEMTSEIRSESTSDNIHSEKDINESAAGIQNRKTSKKSLTNLSRVYISHMRGVSLKTLTRLPIPVKRSFCKRCESPLSSGLTCSREMQNASRGRKKPWADVLVVHCLVCGTEKRFPEQARRGKKLVERQRQMQTQSQSQPQKEEGNS